MTFYKDIDFRLEEDPKTLDIKALEDENAIKVSVINLVLTKMGEKLFQLPKGTNISKLLMDNINPAVIFRLQRQISFVLENYEPRIEVENVQVFFYEEQHLLTAKIYFRIIGSVKILDIDLPLNTLR